ncbi:MAG TPA: hypothetical protein VFP98_03000, partial [Candidatus Polarisedimenticolia bacterium]|nr:hypothetical protein [Candidatus Polarisedimenticolia bacterium]
MRLAAATVLILLAGSMSLGKTLLVDGSAPLPGEDGSPARPFRKIQSALNNAFVGDVVQVAPGTYVENIVVPSGVQLLGAGPSSTFIDGGGRTNTVLIVSEDPNTLLKGFTITGGRGLSGGGVFVAGPATITGNVIIGNRVEGTLQIGGGSLGAGILVSGEALIEDNTILLNTAVSGRGGGIAVGGGIPVITRNVIQANRALAASDAFYGYGGGISIFAGAPLVTSNIIEGNRAEMGGGGIDIYLTQPLVAGNTIIGNHAGLQGRKIGSGGGIHVTGSRSQPNQLRPVLFNNLVTGNSADAGAGGVDVEFANPD